MFINLSTTAQQNQEMLPKFQKNSDNKISAILIVLFDSWQESVSYTLK